MAAAQKFINDGLTTLAVACDAVVTSLTVADATVFPAISGDEFFKMTLAPATTETTYEVVKVTAVAGNVLTVVRGVEGTAQAWSIGAKAENRLTAADITAMSPDGAALKNVLYVTTGSQNDWSPAGLHGSAYIIITASSDPTTITGIDSSFAEDGTLLVVENRHATNGLYLAHASGSSSALNNFDFQAAEDYLLYHNQRVLLIRDGSKWRDFSPKYLVLTDLGTAALEDTTAFDAAGAAAAAQAASQPLDATLTAFAGLTIAADTLTVGTGADAFSQVSFAANTFPAKGSVGGLVAKTITDFGLSFVAAANAAAAITLLGLASIYQPLDAQLTDLAGLSYVGNSLKILRVNAGETGFELASAAASDPSITDDTSTNATMYPVWVTAATGNLPLKVSSTDLTWNPSTNTFALTGGPYTNTQAVAATSTDGLVLATSSTATVGAQKWSPRTRWTGSGWGTTGGAAQVCSWIAEAVPVQGTNPTVGLSFSSSVNGAAYTERVRMADSSAQLASGPHLFIGFANLHDRGSGQLEIGDQSASKYYLATARLNIDTAYLGFSAAGFASTSSDVIIARDAAATVRFGLTAANPPVAQTLSVQDASGTDIAGATWTFRASRGTGAGAVTGKAFSWQTPDVGATGTTLQTATEKWYMNSTGELVNTLPVAATSTDGLVLATSATATSGNQKLSPRDRQRASVWETTGGTAQTLDFIREVVPVQGASAGGSQIISTSVNGAAPANLVGFKHGAGIVLYNNGTASNPAIVFNSSVGGNETGFAYTTWTVHTIAQGANVLTTGFNILRVCRDTLIGWGGQFDSSATPDLYLARDAAASLRFGAAAANPAVAQTLSVQDASGTNIAGAAWTFRESRATGTAKGGGFQWYLGTTLGSGTTLQTAALALDLGVTTYHVLTFADAINIATGTTTGTIICTATTQKLGFYGATPIVQGASVADATGGAVIDAEARTAINALISRIEALGLIATV